MKWLTPDERTKLERWLDSGYADRKEGRYGEYHRLFIAIALESGLRQMEILGKLIHGQGNFIDGRWEGVERLKRKDRARIDANIGPRTRQIYNEIFPNGGEENSIVFKDGPKASAVYKFCRRLGVRLGIGNLTPHRLRHTLGRELSKSGASPQEIKQALGHMTGAMALTYSESTPDEAIEAVKKIRGG